MSREKRERAENNYYSWVTTRIRHFRKHNIGFSANEKTNFPDIFFKLFFLFLGFFFHVGERGSRQSSLFDRIMRVSPPSMPQMCTPTPTTTDMFLTMFAQRCHRLEGGRARCCLGSDGVWLLLCRYSACIEPAKGGKYSRKKNPKRECLAFPNKYASQPFV